MNEEYTPEDIKAAMDGMDRMGFEKVPSSDTLKPLVRQESCPRVIGLEILFEGKKVRCNHCGFTGNFTDFSTKEVKDGKKSYSYEVCPKCHRKMEIFK